MIFIKPMRHGPTRKRLLPEQTLRVMKLIAILLTAFFIQVSAATKAQITLSVTDAPLEKVIKSIKAQSGYDFFYSEHDITNAKTVTVNLRNVTLEKALDEALSGTGLTYQVEEKTVVLKPAERSLLDKLKDKIRSEFAQVTVTAKVYNELGEPMPGVTVRQKETNNVTTTNAKGNFTITVPDNNAIIVFTFIGYDPQELSAKDIPAGSVITLKPNTTNLHEVVINKGYYNERQELTTGDVSVVGSKEIGEQPVSDPIQALEGRVAGLDIQQSSGIPGANSILRIRGVNSIANGTEPLFIVDGVPFNPQSLSSPAFTNALGIGNLGRVSQIGSSGSGSSGGISPFSALNPDDIEDITVLKDADATAIYGSRGANGVIIITTKKGKAGDTKVNIDMNEGVGQVTRMMDLLNTQQYLQMRREAYTNDGLSIPSISTNPTNTAYDINGVWDTTRYTNWQKVLIGNTAQYTNVQASISGGNANTQFLIGGGYNIQTTVYPGDYDDRKGSVHFSLTHSSNDQKFHAQLTASYINDNNDVPTTDFTSNVTLAPDAPPLYNPNGSINWQILNGTATFGGNPLGAALRSSTSVTNNLVSNLDLSYQLLPGLILKSDFGYNHDEMNENWLQPASSFAPPNNTNPNVRQSEFSNSVFQTWHVDPQLTYLKKIGKGSLNALLGTTFEQDSQQNFTNYYYGFSADALITDPQAAANAFQEGYINTLYRYNAIYARIGYNWNEEYLLNITARHDGSSRFGPGRQWGNFGAVGAGWIFTKEKAVTDNLSWLSFGKLRASYGVTGNDQIGDYQYLSTYTPNSTSYLGNAGLAPTALTNPYYGWEVVKKLEGGLDLDFIRNRINLSVNYYRDRTDNQLVGYPLPSIAGFTTVEYNLPAVVQNTGLEVELNTINFKMKDFSWTTSANFTLPQNKLVSYPGLATSPYANTYVIGQSLFIGKYYHFIGVNPQTGLYTFATNNANGTPSSPQDKVVTAPITQKYYGGVQNTFTYKGFGLDIFIQYVKQLGLNYLKYLRYPGAVNYNEPTAILGAWQTPGEITNIQRYSTTSPASSEFTTLQSSTAAITDASFIRLKNVALSYRLPAQWQRWAHMQNAKVYIQAQNLFTITNYLGLDPETQGLTLPPLRMITAGVSVSF